MKIEIKNQQITLLPEKALFWEKEKVLAFSDVHLGKAESFQAFGVPIPSTVHHEDLKKMAGLIEKYNPEEILILGDLIHKKNSWSERLLNELKDFFKPFEEIKWTLLMGNHEKGSEPYLRQLPLILRKEDLERGPFIFSHGHQEINGFAIQGHVHPVFVLREGPVRLRLPCFVLNSEGLTLPSFGVFTGGYEISPKKNQKVFLVVENKIIEGPSPNF